MSTYSLSHLSDSELLRGLATHIEQERQATAELSAHIAEVEARGLNPLNAPSPEPATSQPSHPNRFAIAFTISRSTYDKLRHAQALLGDEFDPAGIDGVLEMALETLIGGSELRARFNDAS